MNEQKDTNLKTPIGLVVAAHAPLGSALVEAALMVLGESQAHSGIIAVDIANTEDPSASMDTLQKAIRKLKQQGPVLVLADLFGGTAANIALSQLGQDVAEVLTGANLAMVVTACSKRNEVSSANELARLAVKSAQDSMAVAGTFFNTTKSASAKNSGADATAPN